MGLKGKKGGKFVGQVGKYFRSAAKRCKGQLIDRGGNLMMEIQWTDAPALFAKQCVGKKDNFDVSDFLQDYKVVKIDRVRSSASSIAAVVILE